MERACVASPDGSTGPAAITAAAMATRQLLWSAMRGIMLHAPYTLDGRSAGSVLEAVREVCVVRGWHLVASHVRSTHVHCVVDGVDHPNRAIADFKAYASRALNLVEGYRQRWAREGSTRRLQNNAAIHAAVRYVVDGQGDAMAVYESAESPLTRRGCNE